MDDIDLQILNELMEDAQKPFTAIAKKLSISHETVRKRYEKMLKEGIIQRCSVVVDRSKLGYQGTMFLLISNSQGKHRSETIDVLKKIPNMIMIGKVMGDFDIFASVAVRDLRDMAKTVEDIQNLPTVDRLEIGLLTFTYFFYKPVPRTLIRCDKIELT